MKTNRNIWRVLSLVLALVMLFAVVACTENGDADATTAGTNATTAATTTKATTKETTAAKTTQATTTAATTAAPTAQNSAQYTVAGATADTPAGSYTVYNHIPAAFTGEGAIVVDAASYDQTTSVGVGDADRGGFTHYYVNDGVTKDDQGNEIPVADKHIDYKFTVTEAGTYTILFGLSVKDNQQRGVCIQVDDQTKVALDFTVPASDFNPDNNVWTVVNATNGAWVAVDGLTFDLAAGEHTFTLTFNSQCPKSLHFRSFTFVKAGGEITPPAPVVPAPTVDLSGGEYNAETNPTGTYSVFTGESDTSWYDNDPRLHRG